MVLEALNSPEVLYGEVTTSASSDFQRIHATVCFRSFMLGKHPRPFHFLMFSQSRSSVKFEGSKGELDSSGHYVFGSLGRFGKKVTLKHEVVSRCSAIYPIFASKECYLLNISDIVENGVIYKICITCYSLLSVGY